MNWSCLLYTSDAADERSSVDLGGRRIIKKKKSRGLRRRRRLQQSDIRGTRLVENTQRTRRKSYQDNTE